MARPPIEDRSAVRDSVLTLRLATADRVVLQALIAARRAEMVNEGVEVTAASVVRWLLRQEAQRRGLTGVDERPPTRSTRSKSPAPRPRSSKKR